MIINEAMARQFWPKGDPLERPPAIGRGGMREFAAEPDRQIIGVVADSRDGSLTTSRARRCSSRRRRCPTLANALNIRITPMAWVVRTAGEPDALIARSRRQLSQTTGLPVTDARVMSEVSRARPRASGSTCG